MIKQSGDTRGIRGIPNSGGGPLSAASIEPAHQLSPVRGIVKRVAPDERDEVDALALQFSFLGIPEHSIPQAVLYSLGYLATQPRSIAGFSWAKAKKEYLRDEVQQTALYIRGVQSIIVPLLSGKQADGERVAITPHLEHAIADRALLRSVRAFTPGVQPFESFAEIRCVHALRLYREAGSLSDGETKAPKDPESITGRLSLLQNLGLNHLEWKIWYAAHHEELLAALGQHYIREVVTRELSSKYPEHVRTKQEEVIGHVVELVHRVLPQFDPARAQIGTYIQQRVRGGLVDWVRGNDSVPRNLRDRYNTAAELDESPDSQAHLAALEEQIHTRGTVSLSTPVSSSDRHYQKGLEGDFSLEDMVPSSQPDTLQQVVLREEIEGFRDALRLVASPSDQMAFLLSKEGNQPLTKIAALLGVSSPSVFQHNAITLSRLQEVSPALVRERAARQLDFREVQLQGIGKVLKELRRREVEGVRVASTGIEEWHRELASNIPKAILSERPRIIARQSRLLSCIDYNKRYSEIHECTSDDFGRVLSEKAQTLWAQHNSRKQGALKHGIVWEDFRVEWIERGAQAPLARGFYSLQHILKNNFSVTVTLDLNQYDAHQFTEAHDFFHAWAMQNGVRIFAQKEKVGIETLRWVAYHFSRSHVPELNALQPW